MKRRFLVAVVAVAAGIVALTCGVALAGDEAAPAVEDVEIVVFYFHGNVRCATCKTIEAYTDEAVHSGFPEALADGELEWRVVNIDDPGNRHFIQDFQLVTRSVVLAEYRDGDVVRFENLNQVWQLVRDKRRFVEYVQSETRAFLGAS